MAALGISSGTKADCPNGMSTHVVGMLLVHLGIGAKLQMHILGVYHGLAHQKITRGIFLGDTLLHRELIDPKIAFLTRCIAIRHGTH